MLQILINGTPTQVGAIIPDTIEIHSLSITKAPFPIEIPKHQQKQVAEWFYDLTQRTTNIIIYNNIIIQKEDIIDISGKL